MDNDYCYTIEILAITNKTENTIVHSYFSSHDSYNVGPPSNKLVYNPINCRYNPKKPYLLDLFAPS